MSVTRRPHRTRRARLAAILAGGAVATGLVFPGQALALTAGDLAATCASEATVSNADPRYQTGLCELHLDAALDELRQTAACTTPVTTHEAESRAAGIFQEKLAADPALADHDADETARQVLAEAFGCQTEK